MTQFQHYLLGVTILIILWYVWVHKLLITQKNMKDLKEELKDWL